MSSFASGQPPGPDPSLRRPGIPFDAARRPRRVTAAAVFAFICAVVQILGALLSFLIAATERPLFGPPGLGYAYALLDLALAVLSVWGGIAALRGKTNKVLVYTALVLAAGQIIQTTTTIAFHYGSPVSTILGLVLALVVVATLMTRRSREFFVARGGTIAQSRPVLITTAVLAVIAVAIAVPLVVTGNSHQQTHSATPPRRSATYTTATVPTPYSTAPSLPSSGAPAGLGATCQYPESQDPAAKPVKPPRPGKVPTDPATVSMSMVTSQGHIGLLLANSQSPCTVNSFISLASQNFFNNTKCHRLTSSVGLAVLQCGDPRGDGTGGPGYQFANEYPTNQYPPNDPKLRTPIKYPRGTLAMAHSSIPDSNGSQFFMVYQDSQLPPDYTIFGKIQDDGLAVLT